MQAATNEAWALIIEFLMVQGASQLTKTKFASGQGTHTTQKASKENFLAKQKIVQRIAKEHRLDCPSAIG